MVHYACLSCGGISKDPGVCKTEECPRKGQPLAECDCEDGAHSGAIPPEEQKPQGYK